MTQGSLRVHGCNYERGAGIAPWQMPITAAVPMLGQGNGPSRATSEIQKCSRVRQALAPRMPTPSTPVEQGPRHGRLRKPLETLWKSRRGGRVRLEVVAPSDFCLTALVAPRRHARRARWHETSRVSYRGLGGTGRTGANSPRRVPRPSPASNGSSNSRWAAAGSRPTVHETERRQNARILA